MSCLRTHSTLIISLLATCPALYHPLLIHTSRSTKLCFELLVIHNSYVMYSFIVIIFACLIGIFFALGLERNPSPAFVTDRRTNVTYQGISDHGLDTFLNIRFGQDTSGAGRFAPPKPFIPAQNSIINATTAGPVCPQPMVPFPPIHGFFSNVTDISEDCLNLRITRPSTPSRLAKLPVMVFIYGGKKPL